MSQANQAKKLRKALRSIYGRQPTDDLVTDALTDLRHLCDVDEVDFDNQNRIAQDHYVTERSEHESLIEAYEQTDTTQEIE